VLVMTAGDDAEAMTKKEESCPGRKKEKNEKKMG